MQLFLTGPAGAALAFGLVDSGADRSVFQASLANLLGFTADDLVTDEADGVGGRATISRLRRGSLTMHLEDIEAADLELRPLFSHDTPFNLLGRADFFRIFDVALYETDQEFHLRDRRV